MSTAPFCGRATPKRSTGTTALDTSPHFHALVPEAVFAEKADGSIELRRLPKPRPEEIGKLIERIARRTLAMLREQMSEDPRLDALDRLRMGVHQQQSFWALEELPGEDVGKLSARCEGFSLQVLRREDGRGNEHRQERLSDEGEGDDTDYRSHRESARLQSESANRPKGLEIVHA